MKTFMNSDVKIFKNNYDERAQFFGTFLFCSLIGFFTGDVLKDENINSILVLEIKSKLMSCDE